MPVEENKEYYVEVSHPMSGEKMTIKIIAINEEDAIDAVKTSLQFSASFSKVMESNEE